MKPDKVVCLNCGQQIQKGKWCSDKCRKAFARNPDKTDARADKKSDISKSDTENSQVGQNPDKYSKLNKTDKSFYDRAMKDFGEPYYKFENEEQELECGYCHKEYKTTLKLNRYCCYNHYSKSLTTLTKKL